MLTVLGIFIVLKRMFAKGRYDNQLLCCYDIVFNWHKAFENMQAVIGCDKMYYLGTVVRISTS